MADIPPVVDHLLFYLARHMVLGLAVFSAVTRGSIVVGQSDGRIVLILLVLVLVVAVAAAARRMRDPGIDMVG